MTSIISADAEGKCFECQRADVPIGRSVGDMIVCDNPGSEHYKHYLDQNHPACGYIDLKKEEKDKEK